MKSKYLFIAFVIVAIVQLFVPLQMIFGQEAVLKTGTAYKFKTEPVDPSDPYRGKYITLNYNINSGFSKDSIWINQQDVYVYLDTDSLGFAKLLSISKTPLKIENDYVIAKVKGHYGNSNRIDFDLPFDRFYMNENKAKPAEYAYRDAQRDTLPNNTYGLVYVKNGKAVLKDVLINNVSIADYVEE